MKKKENLRIQRDINWIMLILFHTTCGVSNNLHLSGLHLQPKVSFGNFELITFTFEVIRWQMLWTILTLLTSTNFSGQPVFWLWHMPRSIEKVVVYPISKTVHLLVLNRDRPKMINQPFVTLKYCCILKYIMNEKKNRKMYATVTGLS